MMADSAPNVEAAPAAHHTQGVQRQLSDLVAKYPSEDKQRQALHAALLADVTSADAWARVLQYEVQQYSVCMFVSLLIGISVCHYCHILSLY